MYKIIVVEDEFLLRRGLIKTMPWTEHECEVIGEAESAAEGIRLVEALHPDIVITDIHMPGMDGLEMIARIKENVDCEFIIFSGYSQFEYAKKAVSLGVHGYLLKPVDDDEFLEVLDETMQSVRKKRRYNKLLAELDRLNKDSLNLSTAFVNKDANGCKDRYLLDAIAYIKANYAANLTGRIVAEKLGISESYLVKLFRANTGYSFLEYITMYRIRQAMELLETTDSKTYQIAAMVGYRDPKYFSDIFRKIVGVTPTQYRNQ